MRRIVIEAASAEEMRPCVHSCQGEGDWFYDDAGDLHIKVATSGSILSDGPFLFAIHELVEAKLCLNAGISQQAVDDFDAAWRGFAEPGDDPAAPYREQHRKAMLIEHMMASFLGITDYGEIR